MEEVVGSIPTRSTNYYQVTQRNETASARFSTLMGLPRRAGSVHEKAIFHQLTRMWTTHGVGNSQSMDARALSRPIWRHYFRLAGNPDTIANVTKRISSSLLNRCTRSMA